MEKAEAKIGSSLKPNYYEQVKLVKIRETQYRSRR